MTMTADHSLRRATILHPNVEQLITDCFDEAQYQIALDFLVPLIGQTAIPSKEVLQQIFVLSVSRPSKRALQTRGVKRRRFSTQPALPRDAPLQATQLAQDLLQQHVSSLAFADALLAAIAPSVEDRARRNSRGRSSRTSRERGSSLGSDQGQISSVVAGVQYLSEEIHDVGDMLNKLTASSKSFVPFHWGLPLPTNSQKKRASKKLSSSDQDAAKLKALQLSSNEAKTWHRLQSIAAQSSTSDLGKALGSEEDVEDYVECLTRTQRYSSERVWQCLEILTRAWQTQRRLGLDHVDQLHGGSSDRKQSKEDRIKQLVSRLDLLRQIAPDRKQQQQLPLDDTGPMLDIVIAGLVHFDSWSDLPIEIRLSSLRVQDRVRCAARLFVELCHLAQLGGLQREALVRGMAGRLVFVGRDELALFNQAVVQAVAEEGDKQASSMAAETLSHAFLRYLALEEAEEEDPPSQDTEATIAERREDMATSSPFEVALGHQSVLLQLTKDLSRGQGRSKSFSIQGEVSQSQLQRSVKTYATMQRLEMMGFIHQHLPEKQSSQTSSSPILRPWSHTDLFIATQNLLAKLEEDDLPHPSSSKMGNKTTTTPKNSHPSSSSISSTSTGRRSQRVADHEAEVEAKKAARRAEKEKRKKLLEGGDATNESSMKDEPTVAGAEAGCVVSLSEWLDLKREGLLEEIRGRLQGWRLRSSDEDPSE